MAELKLSSANTSSMSTNVPDFSVDTENTDGAADSDETTWDFTDWPQYYAYYLKIPELHSAINAVAKWTIGKGYKADNRTTVQLNRISGYGEDSFDTILKNMIITRQIMGDAFAEIIRNKENGNLINIKPLDTGSMRIVVGRNGLIKRYEQVNKDSRNKRFKPERILHLTLNRVGDNIHGTSIIEAVEDIILMKNEALADFRKVLHRNVYPLKIWKLATDDPTKISAFITKVENTVKDKENIFIPEGAAELEIQSIASNATLNPLPWIQHLSSFFYQAVGIPQIILGGASEFSESSAKIAYLSFQQTIEDSQKDIENQLWAQLAMRINLEFPASLENELLSDEKKDKGQGQTAAQPVDTTASLEGRR